MSTQRDGKIDRIEHYERDVLVRAEEDTDGDGTIDKWETYDGARLASVAFDTTHHRGTPDRRLDLRPPTAPRASKWIGTAEGRSGNRAAPCARK